jgi:membrane protein involved in colicin uptake
MNFSLNGMETLSYLESKLSEIESIKVDDSFEEFKIEALEIRGATIDMLKFAIGKAKIAEQERLELAKLRAEAEARAKADREESLRKEGEARAKREAEARIKAEQDKANAEKKMAIAESERKELEARRLADSQAKAVRDAEERAKNAEENARKKIEAEKAKREADENHVIEVKTAVYEAFISLGVPEQLAIDLINAIHAQNAGPVRLII